MTSEIRAISPVFSFEPEYESFCVIKKAKAKLEEMGHRLTEDDQSLVAIYVTESPEEEFNPNGEGAGRIVALVRPLPMPAGASVEDYPSECMHLSGDKLVDRWPVGWPCEVVFLSKRGGPILRDAILATGDSAPFADFAQAFMQGPIDLATRPYLRRQLMVEVRHEIDRNPSALIQPF
ncbi:MAG TPA: hypothetical protein VIF02_02760 [Methylocella sp.]